MRPHRCGPELIDPRTQVNLEFFSPVRIARRRSGEAPRYQLSNGKGASLRDDDPLAREDWLVAADLDGKAREATIYLAAPVDIADLEQDLAAQVDKATCCVRVEAVQRIDAKELATPHRLCAVNLP